MTVSGHSASKNSMVMAITKYMNAWKREIGLYHFSTLITNYFSSSSKVIGPTTGLTMSIFISLCMAAQ